MYSACTYIFINLSGDPVRLTVPTALFVNVEPDSGANQTVSVCFESQINRPLFRSALFILIPSTSTTAMPDVDFFLNSSMYIIIPRGFNGTYRDCINVVLIGDDEVEDNEIIEFVIATTTSTDNVVYVYPENASSVVIYIADNDGKYLGVAVYREFQSLLWGAVSNMT